MAEQKIPVRMPHYFKEFQCIGGSCEDNCCVGWDVEIDKNTFHRYRREKDPELARLFRRSIHENEEASDEAIDYAIVTLEEHNRCPFLNEQNLCKIQAKLGHDALSNVCATFPRFTNQVDGVLEYSATVSCPEAARLILRNKDGIRFLEETQFPLPRMILNYSIQTRQQRGNRMIQYFKELRAFTISVLQNKAYSLEERFLILGHFYEELQLSFQGRAEVGVLQLILSFQEKLARAELAPTEWNIGDALSPEEVQTQLKIVKELLDQMNRSTQIDSAAYLRFSEEFQKGLGLNQKSRLGEETSAYQIAYHQYYEPFLKQHEYLLENYLVNYVFSELFPAAESTKPLEAYLMLVLRYTLIKCSLIGISGFRKGLTVDLCVEFIQAFSKAIEHHHTYLEGLAVWMKKNQYMTLPIAELLVKG